jgi:hypothetical protein
MKPSDPRENATTGGTGPLNNDAAIFHLQKRRDHRSIKIRPP